MIHLLTFTTCGSSNGEADKQQNHREVTELSPLLLMSLLLFLLLCLGQKPSPPPPSTAPALCVRVCVTREAASLLLSEGC